jgi:hypothetical protein
MSSPHRKLGQHPIIVLDGRPGFDRQVFLRVSLETVGVKHYLPASRLQLGIHTIACHFCCHLLLRRCATVAASYGYTRKIAHAFD